MRTVSTFLSLFLLAFSFGRAEIKPPLKFSISCGAGPSVPFGYVGEEHGFGANVCWEINFRFHKNVSLFAMFHNTYFGWKPRNQDGVVSSYLGGEYACLGFLGGVKGLVPIGKRLTLYASVGAGTCEQESGDFIVRVRQPGPGGGWMESETVTFNALQEGYFFGLIAGGGAEYDLSRRFSLFAEIRVLTVFNTGRTPPPQWADLPPEIYQNPPDAVFVPLVIGIRVKIF